MVDLQETPATPPEDPGGDERIGYNIAGGVLVFLGLGLGVVVNLVLHWEAARRAPFLLLGVHFGAALGPFAWGVLGLGAVTGMLGFAVLGLGRATPKGRFVLPGAGY